jgi:hypothetical protein
VSVSSCPPTSYQWFFNQSTALDGETNSDLILTNIGSSQAGSYLVVITNASGSVTSAPANVTVHVPAVIVGNPVDQTATNGDDVITVSSANGVVTVSGLHTNVTIANFDANDRIIINGLGGDDVLDGGPGSDTADYHLDAANGGAPASIS